MPTTTTNTSSINEHNSNNNNVHNNNEHYHDNATLHESGVRWTTFRKVTDLSARFHAKANSREQPFCLEPPPHASASVGQRANNNNNKRPASALRYGAKRSGGLSDGLGGGGTLSFGGGLGTKLGGLGGGLGGGGTPSLEAWERSKYGDLLKVLALIEHFRYNVVPRTSSAGGTDEFILRSGFDFVALI